MPNEPERPIEKLLRDAAKKRGDEAGDTFVLHPATKRMLQGEVGRKFAKEKPADQSFFASLSRLWPRLGLATALFVGLGLIAWMMIPWSRESGKNLSLAKNQPTREIKPPDDAAVLEPAPAVTETISSLKTDTPHPLNLDDSAARDKELNKQASTATPVTPNSSAAEVAQTDRKSSPAPTGAVFDSEKMKEAPASGVASKDLSNADSTSTGKFYSANPSSPSPMSAPTPAAVAATPPPAQLAAAGSPKPGSAKKLESDSYAFKSEDLPSATTTPSTVGSDRSEGKITNYFLTNSIERKSLTQVQQFGRVNKPSDALNGKAQRADAISATLLDSQGPTLLTSFRVEQDGGTLRIIDGDGSVYTGYVQPATSANRRRALKTPADESASTRFGAAEAESVSGQNYTFSVTGTNLTLHKKVVFKGNLTTANNLSLLKMTTNSISGYAAGGTVVQPPRLLLDSHISGKAAVGSGKEIEIEAAPTQP